MLPAAAHGSSAGVPLSGFVDGAALPPWAAPASGLLWLFEPPTPPAPPAPGVGLGPAPAPPLPAVTPVVGRFASALPASLMPLVPDCCEPVVGASASVTKP